MGWRQDAPGYERDSTEPAYSHARPNSTSQKGAAWPKGETAPRNPKISRGSHTFASTHTPHADELPEFIQSSTPRALSFNTSPSSYAGGPAWTKAYLRPLGRLTRCTAVATRHCSPKTQRDELRRPRVRSAPPNFGTSSLDSLVRRPL